MRVVSLLSSATEIVCALGLKETLVGRSHECDYPEDIRTLPRCSDPAIAVDGSSADIDRAVKTAARNALSIYRVDETLLAELKPDLVLTQTQCEVCAVSLKDVEAALAKLTRRETRVVALSPQRLADVYDDVRRVASALGAAGAGRALVLEMQKRLAALAARVELLERPKIAVLEWLDPLLAAGHWIPELAMIAGGRDVFGVVGERGPWLSLERLREADPDLIVAAPCGFDMRRTQPELAALVAQPVWRELRAVRRRRVYLADGNQFFNRPGPRLVETAEILAEMLHPELRFGHEGKGWRQFDRF